MNSSQLLLSWFLVVFVTLSTGTLWPKLSCLKWYDVQHQKVFKVANSYCEESNVDFTQTKALGLDDKRACVLYRMKGIHISDGKKYKFTAYKGLRKVFLNIFSGTKEKASTLPNEANEERVKFVHNLLERSEPCDHQLNEVANVKKYHSKDWGPFYDCVENAWKC